MLKNLAQGLVHTLGTNYFCLVLNFREKNGKSFIDGSKKSMCIFSCTYCIFFKKIFLKGRKGKKMKVTLGYILGLSLKKVTFGYDFKSLNCMCKIFKKTHRKKKIYNLITPKKVSITRMGCRPYLKYFIKKIGIILHIIALLR